MTDNDGVEECVEGAKVTVAQGDALLGEATSDAFGEFAVLQLERDIGDVELSIEVGGKTAKTVELVVSDSVYVGCVAI